MSKGFITYDFTNDDYRVFVNSENDSTEGHNYICSGVTVNSDKTIYISFREMKLSESSFYAIKINSIE